MAYVDAGEIAHIEGFDEDTAKEIQTRARDYLERQEAERDAKRKELGVSDDLAKVPGVTTAMLVAFGENGIKTVEDLADCATDDLIGWTERKKEKDAEPVRHKGVLEGFEISRKDAEDMIMAARIAAGWVTAGGHRQDARRAGRGGSGGRGCQGSGRGAGRRQGLTVVTRSRTIGDGRTRQRPAMRRTRRATARCACAPSRARTSRLRS